MQQNAEKIREFFRLDIFETTQPRGIGNARTKHRIYSLKISKSGKWLILAAVAVSLLLGSNVLTGLGAILRNAF
jgi:hypothetical protein